MLVSLPMFVCSQGLRLVVKFVRDTTKQPGKPAETPLFATVCGWVFCALFLLFSIALWSIHLEHMNVFRERYAIMTDAIGQPHMQAFTSTLQRPRVTAVASKK